MRPHSETSWPSGLKVHSNDISAPERCIQCFPLCSIGDGVTDDTDAINRALSEGRDVAAKLTTQPAVVYLPPGKYAVSKTLQMAFYTFIHGNPLCPPTVLWLGQGEVRTQNAGFAWTTPVYVC
eukprot:SAG31_NODE_11_length_38734_cov_21.263854_20_plen_123_part_00